MSLDTERPYILTIRGVLGKHECTQLIARIDAAQPKLAPISTPFGELARPDVRNNERVMFEDRALATHLYERVAQRAPADIFGRRLVGANELLRCYRYRPGARFAPHADGAFERDATEQSYYTLLVYLNEGFGGGNTTFLVEPEVSIRPETGMALLFQHAIIHEGSLVTSGTKYVVRSDLMYRAA
jgi:predicted 2-oxoglutarate/Fe(II)-dependent dioxygenase YbiX